MPVSQQSQQALVYLINDDSLADSVCENLASMFKWRPRKADNIADVIFYSSTAVLIHRDCIEPFLYNFLKEAFIDPVPEELRELDPDFDWDAPFEGKYIVYGEGPEIPRPLKPFFIETGRLNFNHIYNILKP